MTRGRRMSDGVPRLDQFVRARRKSFCWFLLAMLAGVAAARSPVDRDADASSSSSRLGSQHASTLHHRRFNDATIDSRSRSDRGISSVQRQASASTGALHRVRSGIRRDQRESANVDCSSPNHPPLYEPQDEHALRHVLDCGDACVYRGSSSLSSKRDGGASSSFGSASTSSRYAAAARGSAGSSKRLDVGSGNGRAAASTVIVPVRKLSRKMQCPNAWLRLLSSCPASDWPPPRHVPETLRDAFTMDGRSKVSDHYFSQRYSGGEALLPHWVASDLDARIAAPSLDDAMKDIISYSMDEARYLERAIALYADEAIADRVGVVWGSEKPWVEVLLARHGARQVVTVEYGRIKVDKHSVISATTPSQLAAVMLTRPRSFDFAVTFSSLEHSGLGRYGDSLNPFGDIEAAVQTWCLLRPGGIFLLGVPAADPSASRDELVWNAHRFYGPHRLAEMFAGYEHVESVDTREFGETVHLASIVHVLRKPQDEGAAQKGGCVGSARKKKGKDAEYREN